MDFLRTGRIPVAAATAAAPTLTGGVLTTEPVSRVYDVDCVTCTDPRGHLDFSYGTSEDGETQDGETQDRETQDGETRGRGGE